MLALRRESVNRHIAATAAGDEAKLSGVPILGPGGRRGARSIPHEGAISSAGRLFAHLRSTATTGASPSLASCAAADSGVQERDHGSLARPPEKARLAGERPAGS
jgi:hypothetical protein